MGIPHAILGHAAQSLTVELLFHTRTDVSSDLFSRLSKKLQAMTVNNANRLQPLNVSGN